MHRRKGLSDVGAGRGDKDSFCHTSFF
jgi:hypothetical protein